MALSLGGAWRQGQPGVDWPVVEARDRNLDHLTQALMVEKVGVEACQLTCVAALYQRDVGRPGRCAAGDGEGAVIRHGERTAGIRAVKRRAAKSLGDGADRAVERHAGDLRQDRKSKRLNSSH